jgi:hypothetical protein
MEIMLDPLFQIEVGQIESYNQSPILSYRRRTYYYSEHQRLAGYHQLSMRIPKFQHQYTSHSDLSRKLESMSTCWRMKVYKSQRSNHLSTKHQPMHIDRLGYVPSRYFLLYLPIPIFLLHLGRDRITSLGGRVILYSADRELGYRLGRRCSGGVGGGSRSLSLLGRSK